MESNMKYTKLPSPEYKIIKQQLRCKNKILFYLDTPTCYKASLIEAYYSKDEARIYIIDLGTKEECRGMGFASLLLKRIIKEAYKLHCKNITLDDASDLFGKTNNIYLKHGFEYINEGQPEMIKYLI